MANKSGLLRWRLWRIVMAQFGEMHYHNFIDECELYVVSMNSVFLRDDAIERVLRNVFLRAKAYKIHTTSTKSEQPSFRRMQQIPLYRVIANKKLSRKMYACKMFKMQLDWQFFTSQDLMNWRMCNLQKSTFNLKFIVRVKERKRKEERTQCKCIGPQNSGL